MLTILIGHRGVGKTQFLKRITETYLAHGREVLALDLDQEIAKKMGSTVQDLFAKGGEKQFREWESGTFRLLYEQIKSEGRPVFMALGAGFEFDLPQEAHVLWIRRLADDRGRIFLDRPRLNPTLRPLDEFNVRARKRAERFRMLAHEHYFLREGAFQDPKADAYFLGFSEDQVGGSLTVLPWMLRESFFAKRLKWGVRYFELRDDLLTREQIAMAFQWIPQPRRILARRKRESGFTHEQLQTHKVDWPIELGVAPRDVPDLIVSLHDRSKLLEQDFERLASHKTAYLKCAVKIRSLAELRAGHRWWCEQPDRRSFLPNSETGEFRWYRGLYGRQMEVAYFREDEGSALDQPLLAEWIHTQGFEKYFAAILGDPVEHSWTPAEQQEFFARYGLPTVRVRLSREEANLAALETLRGFGLVAAGVTSPLKQNFVPTESLNTGAWDFIGSQWQFTSTDGMGFAAALAEVKGAGIDVSRWAVWGGGGILPALKEHLSSAAYFAARTGQPRSSQDGALSATQGLVWAAGGEAAVFPPASYKPLVILDLSYSENSLAREYAQTSGARYFSGSTLFKAQAVGQRNFFEPLLAHFPRRIAAKIE